MNYAMRFIFILLNLTILLITTNSHAQAFHIKDGSDLYDANIEVLCAEDQCSGTGRIILYQKNTQNIIQQFTSDDLNFEVTEKSKPTVNIIQRYNEQSALIFDDFNFDGSEDIAIRNGNNGGYGGPTYDVYVFLKHKKKFILSQELTDLTYENLGMFEIDDQKKRILTNSKSGCCYHQAAEYSVVPQKGLVLVKEVIEDARSEVGGERVRVTHRELINGQWNEIYRYYLIDEYYK